MEVSEKFWSVEEIYGLNEEISRLLAQIEEMKIDIRS